MKLLRLFFLILFLIPCLSGLAQSKTVANITEAYRFEAGNIILFTAYAEQADKEGLQKVATFFRAIAKAASVHAGNFQKVLSQIGVTVAPPSPSIHAGTTKLNLEDALKKVRVESGITYEQYLDQAKTDGEDNAIKALRWAKETEQKSLQYFVNVDESLSRTDGGTLPAFYWVCPKCGNIYDIPDPEKECSFCYTEKEKFINVK